MKKALFDSEQNQIFTVITKVLVNRTFHSLNKTNDYVTQSKRIKLIFHFQKYVLKKLKYDIRKGLKCIFDTALNRI